MVTDQQVIPTAEQQLFQLPNQLKIFHLYRTETQWLYDEIFVDQSYLKHGIVLTDGSCVFDVGANIGLFTLFVQQRYPNAQVYAFEPIPPICETLRNNIDLYGMKAHLFQYGLSNGPGEAEFTFYHSFCLREHMPNTGNEEVTRATLRNQGELLAQYSDELLANRFKSETFTCQLRNRSEVIRENAIQHIDLLKIDVEKSELDVLNGIQEEDWQKIEQIVVEVHDQHGHLALVIGLLRRHDYYLTVEQADLLTNTGLYTVYARRSSRLHSIAAEYPRNTSPDRLTPLFSRYLVSATELQRFLHAQVPDYMVPASFVQVDALPLTPNGKVDRAALPVPDETNTLRDRHLEAASTPIEQRLAGIMGSLLSLERIGRDDNFFMLGGHSLLGTQVIARVAKISESISPCVPFLKHLPCGSCQLRSND